MLEIIAHGDKFVVRRHPSAEIGHPAERAFDYWTGSRWSSDVSEAMVFDSESSAEECRVVG